MNKSYLFKLSMMSAAVKLMRLDKPIGILLLLWPTLWALWLANQGMPPLKLLGVFVLGTFFMRAAGCIINDIADRNVDGKVKRTRHRPLVNGELSLRVAITLFIINLALSASLLFFIDVNILYWAIAGAVLAIFYPFCKRFLATPQLILGFAFSWGIPLAFLSSKQTLNFQVLLLMLVNFLWIICYDTYYAMVDKDDDLKIGVKSTAIFFADKVRLVICSMQLTIALLWLLLAFSYQLSLIFYPLFLVAHGLFIYQFWITNKADRDSYFKAFLNNHWYGLTMFLALALSV